MERHAAATYLLISIVEKKLKFEASLATLHALLGFKIKKPIGEHQ